ncbi:MAG: C13 family peptidase [Cetobacterium sp.]
MSGKKWALLVAGSKGWENYRHQVCPCFCYFHCNIAYKFLCCTTVCI